MEQVMPWGEVRGVIEPHYPKGKQGRPPVGLERMLRAYLVQQWYNLSDESAENEITDSQALRGFVGIDLSRESAPDATTLLQFRHLLEKHELTKKVLEEVQREVAAFVPRHITRNRTNISIASPSNCRAFAMAYVLARQDMGSKLSAPKTTTPLNAMFCGVFRVYLLTSTTPQMSYLRS
jgi:hypothetical protein